ncbi:heavy metal translocating P-type ATPase [Desulforamulus aquiferis]|uniref:Cd(2+)-exporting ATPase n=1 Tax=Desulforamulus aquiferis TaxID=1397668 RepID=A0AAW7Z9I1_9FIRM|nr:cation-translocating P-type ATPase [Desulforamulus aquiferis]MDO7786304.1 cation-translocating P-type ATPase [Desulforamulus aquiferis]
MEKDKIDHEQPQESAYWLEYAIIGITGILILVYWLGGIKEFAGVNLALLAAVIGGYPIVKEALIAVVTRGDTKVGLLVSIALIASISIGEYLAAAEVAFIMLVGELLEHITLEKSNKSINKLVDLKPLRARVLKNNTEIDVNADQLHIGDIVLVKSGDKIPVDGTVVKGHASVNQATITGESIPVAKVEGDSVLGGSINISGYMEIKATRVGEETALGHIITLVKQAQNSKAPIQRLVDKYATWFIPASLIIATMVFIITRDITRAVTILIVFCPCAMLLSTPTAVMAAIGNAARKGILIKGGEVLERTGKINAIVFDKTGTITRGTPEVKEIVPLAISSREILQYAAIAEKFSEHHLAEAIIKYGKKTELHIPSPDAWQVHAGLGVTAIYQGKKIILGSIEWISGFGIQISEADLRKYNEMAEHGCTTVALVIDNILCGFIGIADLIRENAAASIRDINNLKINKIMMLTGDNTLPAKYVANQVGINEYVAQQLPEGKANTIRQIQDKGFTVAMIGDGVNDAPSLATADVGIAMGISGTDVAVETANIALLSDDLSKIPGIISLSRNTLAVINQNIWFANGINLISIILASSGILGPILAAIVHNLSAIVVILNSSRLIKSKI